MNPLREGKRYTSPITGQKCKATSMNLIGWSHQHADIASAIALPEGFLRTTQAVPLYG